MVQTTSHIFSGKVDIESNLLVGSSHLFVDTINNRVGITTADPDASLHVNGNAYVESNVGVGSNIKLDGDTGIITATGFVGDASQLTGLASNLEQVVNNGNVTSNTIQFINTGTSLTASGNVVIDGNVSSTTALISNVATIGTTKTFVVTVGGNGKYHIDGVDRPSLELHEHQTYIFDFSSSTLLGGGANHHPFIFSETVDGTGTPYTTGITTTGNYGSDQIRTFVVPAGAPSTLYYYCTAHPGMGATVSISPTAELVVSGRVVADFVSSKRSLISNVETIGTTKTFGVTWASTGGGNKYFIDADQQATIELHEHQKYIFDLSQVSGHPFKLSTTSDGTHGGGSEYTTGVDHNVTNKLILNVQPGTPSTLYYYCTAHSAMGGQISISPTAELIVSGRVVASGNVEASTFIGDGSQLTGVVTSISLQDATDAGNTTSNTTQFTNTGTSLTASGSIVVSGGVNAAYLTGDGSNVNIGQMAAETVPYVDSNKQLRDSHITRTANKTIITSNLEVIGNVITQNNITVGAQGSYYGDGTTLTGVALSTDLSDNVIRIGNLETATIISNSSTITTGFTKGDIIYASDDNVLNKLAVGGTDGHVLKVTNAANKTLGWGVETNQWNTVNTNEIHYSGGNVGINVSDPAFKLDVHGTANVGALTATSLSVGGQALALEADLTANASRIDAIYSGSVGDIIYVDATNSLAKRSIGAQGDVLKVSAGGIPVWDGEPDVSSQWSNVTVDEVYFDGNVGISNTNPGHDLSVGSNLFVDDDGSNVLVISGNAAMTALTLGEVSIVASHGLGDILNESNTSPNTMELTNATTGLVATGNVHALKFIGDGSELTNIASNLDQIVNNGNVTSNTIELTNATTGLVATGNVHALKFIGSGSELTNLASNLEEIVNNGNVASNTIELTNATTSLVASGNVEVGGELTVSGTGALTVPAGATGDRPATAANGMIRYNTTTGFMEAYSGGVWAPIAQPPTVTGISPLTTLTSGGTTIGWTEEKIVANNPSSSDNFGRSVAMNSDGTRVLVTAPNEDSQGTDTGAGYIYIYSGGSWDAGHTLLASVPNYSYLGSNQGGRNSAMDSAGMRVIIGAPNAGPSATYQGRAYIFDSYGTNNSSWWAPTEITAGDAANNDYFGQSVAMSSDGLTVIVGAPGENGSKGAFYIFTTTTASPGFASSWTQQTKVVATSFTGPADQTFGCSVDMSSGGTKFIVGAKYEDTGVGDAGSAYIYTYDGSSWGNLSGSEEHLQAWDKELTDLYGMQVAISGDGTKIAVGAPYEDGGSGSPLNTAGAVYTYIYDSFTSLWGSEQKIMASDKAAGDYFGYSIDMNSNGTKLIVGAYNADAPASDSGHAYVYKYIDGSWGSEQKIQSSDTASDDMFGSSVAMNSDGTMFIVGAYKEDSSGTDEGSAYIYGSEVTAENQLFDTSTQVFTATGTGIVNGSTVQLEGANGTLYSVSNVTPNAAGTQVTFKMGIAASIMTPSEYDAVNNDAYSMYFEPNTPSPYNAGNYGNFLYDNGAGVNTTNYLQWSDHPPNVALAMAQMSSFGGGTPPNCPATQLWIDIDRRGTNTYRIVGVKSSSQIGGFLLGVRPDGFVLAQQPYKVRINSTSGLTGTSTVKISFPPTWITAVGTNLIFDITQSQPQTLLGTDGGGGTNRTFSISPLSAVQTLPSGLNDTNLSAGVITGQITETGTTPVKFRLTDNANGLFIDREIDIVGSVASLYTFSLHTFTNAGATGRLGPTFPNMKSAYNSTVWYNNPAWFNEISGKQGFQLWTIPQTGTYRITVNGGRGGDTTSTHSGNNQPGLGAQIRADFALTEGTKLVIIVGQSARTAEYTVGEAAGGGGGGTWVLKENFTTSTNDIYMVAGGGAGQANYAHSGLTAASGGTSQASVSDTGGGETSQGDTARNAGGGAGWGSNGLGTGSTYPGVTGQDTGGYRPSVGAMGGDYTYGTPTWDGQGGFGGGGSSSIQIPGGGGGFSGGNAAYHTDVFGSSWGHAQGGTSYIMPNGTGGITVTNRVFVGTHGNREGSVVIELNP